MPIAINQLTISPLDPTAQKIADLEARLAKLESVLSVGVNGEATLKSATTVTIEAGTSLWMRSTAAVKMDASTTITMKALATFEATAFGTMTLKGATVNLN
jgi:hypothetical protein